MLYCCGIYGTRRDCGCWPTGCCMMPYLYYTPYIGWYFCPRAACDGLIPSHGSFIRSFFSFIAWCVARSLAPIPIHSSTLPLNAPVLLGVFFGLGVALTAIDHALGSGERERSGLGR